MAAVWFGMTILGLIVLGAIKSDSINGGDPDRLLNAIDYDGFQKCKKKLKMIFFTIFLQEGFVG